MKFSQVKPLCVLRGEGARAETSETFASLGAQEHLKVGKSSHLPAIGVLCCPGMEADPNWKEFRQQTQTVTHPQLEQLQLRPSTGPQESPGVPSSCSSRRAQTQPRHLPRAAFHLHQPGQGKGMLRAQPRLQLLHRFIKHTGISWEMRRDSRSFLLTSGAGVFKAHSILFVEQKDKRSQHNHRHLTSHRNKLPIPPSSFIQTKTATKHLKALIMVFLISLSGNNPLHSAAELTPGLPPSTSRCWTAEETEPQKKIWQLVTFIFSFLKLFKKHN